MRVDTCSTPQLAHDTINPACRYMILERRRPLCHSWGVIALATLGRGDEAELEQFLVAHADSSMFLRGNSRAAGLVDAGARLQATYVVAREDGVIVAVAAHCWNGNVIVQGRADALADAARAAVARSGRAVRGINGPYAQVVATRAALGLDDQRAMLDAREDLLALALADLRVPDALADGRVVCRRPLAHERETLARWSYAYEVEAIGYAPDPMREAERVASFAPGEAQRVLAADGELVASTTFNAQLPDVVQVGGVYTPPARRNRGYARAVVAGSLLEARAHGVSRSILFVSDPAARRAYLALGYRRVGDYGIVMFP